jgi:hypothetical protein
VARSLLVSRGKFKDSEIQLQILRDYGLTISVEKPKVMAFPCKEPKRSEIVIDNKSIEQVNTFNYQGTLVSYENKKYQHFKKSQE